MDVNGSIEIDTGRCIGAATCTRLAPDVFTQDDDGVAELLPGGATRADDALLREAVLGCPVQAITVRAS